MSWKVETLNQAVERELRALTPVQQAHFLRVSELLETFGPPRVGMPHVRSLGKGLWEMRLRDATGIARAIYAIVPVRRLVVAHLFTKIESKDATPGIEPGAGAGQGDRIVTKSLKQLKAEMLDDEQVKAAYEALAPEYELAAEMIGARQRAGLTQTELAARMGTTQSVIARLESGRTLPTMKTIARYAAATGSRPQVRLVAAE
jgi:phage-related protein/DNA-binding XRE family transcriptional regulator